MNKSTILMLMASISLSPLGATESVTQVEVLQKQIETLQKQLETLAKQVKEQITQVKEIKTENKQLKEHHTVKATPTSKEELKNENISVFEKGYVQVPGTKAGVKISGMVKLAVIRDAKAHTSEQTNVSRVPYTLQTRNPSYPNTPTSWKEHFNVHAKQSKIRIDSVIKNTSGTDTKGFIEGDFFGGSHWGDAVSGGTTGNTTNSSTAYNFRLRHAVLSYGGLEAGHTTTTFHLDEANLPSVDLNGISGGYGRHALIRYTHKLDKFSIIAAAEHGRADYVSYSPGSTTTAQYAYNTQDSAGNLSKQTRPDLIMKVKYNFDSGSAVGLSVVNRDLRIKNNAVIGSNAATTVDGRTYKTNAWGANLAAKIMTFGKSFFTGGVSTGKGIGWYILEMNGRSALFDPAATTEGQRYKAIGMTMFWAGYSHVWNPQWQTSIGVAQIKLKTKAMSNTKTITRWFEPGLDRSFNKFLINTMYKPEDNLEFGLEYFVLQRKSTLNYNGLGQRLQFGASYKF